MQFEAARAAADTSHARPRAGRIVKAAGQVPQ
jgi:hypothetical protein